MCETNNKIKFAVHYKQNFILKHDGKYNESI